MSHPGVTRRAGGRMFLWGSWESALEELGGLVCAEHGGAVHPPPCSTLKPPPQKPSVEPQVPGAL